MSEYISCADTAKLVRKTLKDNFPGIKFSVRSSTYSGGASIRVNWTDGPSDNAVEAVVKRFEGSRFDGMTDSTTYIESEWEGKKVRFGADSIHCDHSRTRVFVEKFVSEFCKQFHISIDEIEIRGTDTNAWANTYRLDYWGELQFSDLLRSTDAKDIHRVFEAEEEREAQKEREFVEWEAKQREAEARAEQERIAREQAEFEQWKLNNEATLRKQFALWKQEQERLEAKRRADEQAERERLQREQEARMRREKEEREHRQRQEQARQQFRLTQRTVLASRELSLKHLGLSLGASRDDVMVAFRQKVKDASDGKGGYTVDMDFLVKVKEKALLG